MRKCARSEHTKDISICEQFHEIRIRCFLQWSDRHRHFVQSNSMGVCKYLLFKSSSHCRTIMPLFTKRPRESKSESEFIEMAHAINYAYEMPYKVPCANSYGSSNLIRLCQNWVIILIISLIL